MDDSSEVAKPRHARRMSKMKKMKYSSAIKFMEPLHMCQRCILRFVGQKNHCYFLTDERVSDALKEIEKNNDILRVDLTSKCEESTVPEKRHCPSLCCTCLGLLQDYETMVKIIEEAVINGNFKFNDFSVNISLPVTTDLRQTLMHHYIQDNLGKDYILDDEDIVCVKRVLRWLIQEHLSTALSSKYSSFSIFQINISVDHPDDVSFLCPKLLESCPEAFAKSKGKTDPEMLFNRTSLSKAVLSLSSEIKKLYSLPLDPLDKPCTYKEVQCRFSDLYIGGRYNKYTRQLSQTPWLVDGERRLESSVQERITDIMSKWISADVIRFSASGREDCDVKMLGNGRPFVLEFINPKRVLFSTEEIKAMEEEINASTDQVAVRQLQVITKKDTQLLKEGEEEKTKSYSAICYIKRKLHPDDEEKLNSITTLTLQQKMPIRVLHRRPLAVRERIIHEIKCKIIDVHTLRLNVHTQAGTYVKEFVHGDFGRTKPNLGTLLDTEADILELDVESVHLDWPPKCCQET